MSLRIESRNILSLQGKNFEVRIFRHPRQHKENPWKPSEKIFTKHLIAFESIRNNNLTSKKIQTLKSNVVYKWKSSVYWNESQEHHQKSDLWKSCFCATFCGFFLRNVWSYFWKSLGFPTNFQWKSNEIRHFTSRDSARSNWIFQLSAFEVSQFPHTFTGF